jgi:hypothetical protein
MMFVRLFAFATIVLVAAGCDQSGSEETTTEIVDETFTTIETYQPAQRSATNDSTALVDTDPIRIANNSVAFKSFRYGDARGGNFVAAPATAVLTGGLILADGRNGPDAIPLSVSTGLSAAFFAWRQALTVDVAGLHVGTRVWGQRGYRFLRSYLDLATAEFGATLEAYDFLTSDTLAHTNINQWLAAESTEPHPALDAFYTGVDSTTRIVVATDLGLNAPFDTSSTPTELIDGLYENFDGTQIRIPMVRRVETLPFLETESYKATELSLGSGTVSMLVVMPSKQKFGEVESAFEQVIAAFDQSAAPTKIDFALPRFDVSSSNPVDIWRARSAILDLPASNCRDNNGSCTASEDNFANVNGVGYLKDGHTASVSRLSFDTDGARSSSVSMHEIEATPDEPPWIIIGAPGDLPGSDAGVIITFPDPCFEVYQAAGPTQSRAFLFAVRDSKTHTVLQLGKMTSFDAARVGSRVCSEDLVTYPDAIWNAAP